MLIQFSIFLSEKNSSHQRIKRYEMFTIYTIESPALNVVRPKSNEAFSGNFTTTAIRSPAFKCTGDMAVVESALNIRPVEVEVGSVTVVLTLPIGVNVGALVDVLGALA